ncbi:MAG: heme exporter protein CcmD [Acidiferrobacteraceae bacterium]|jgi:heme exporter protein D
MNWSRFFAMGGFAVYVWSAYGFAAVVLTLNVVIPLRQRKTILKRISRFLRFDQGDQS